VPPEPESPTAADADRELILAAVRAQAREYRTALLVGIAVGGGLVAQAAARGHWTFVWVTAGVNLVLLVLMVGGLGMTRATAPALRALLDAPETVTQLRRHKRAIEVRAGGDRTFLRLPATDPDGFERRLRARCPAAA
jgi:hypothetical protein